MVRMLTAAVIGGVCAGSAAAQTTGQMVTPGGPFAVPGVAVGQSVLPVGQRQAPVGQPAGTPIGFVGPGGMAINTTPPPGQVIDLTNLAAPLTAPLPPGLGPTQSQSVLQRLYNSWATAIGIQKPPPQNLQTSWTPGISRRNRERAKQAWVRD
jgi:hypothetical protein